MWYNNGTQYYTGSTMTVTASVIGVADGTNVQFSYKVKNTFTDKGEYTVIIEIDDPNYKFANPYDAQTTLEII